MKMQRSLLNQVFRSRWMPLVLSCGMACPVLCAQAPAAPQTASAAGAAKAELPAYDVVTIKRDKSASGMVRVSINENVFEASNVSLKMLLAQAFDVHQDEIFGLPDWAEGARFDIMAKTLNADTAALEKLSRKERSAMMRAVLEDRFKIKTHMETKTLPVYNLVVGKGGSKLEKFVDSDAPDKETGHKGGGWMRMSGTSLQATGIEVSGLANSLTDRLHRKVIDKTGLTGQFNFKLDWTPDASTAGDHDGPGDREAGIFSAVEEQLGLKLEAAKGPVDTLVVDHVEMPSED
ncbi:MAG: TIGR03435 family protein [Acidobacteriota bacterium]